MSDGTRSYLSCYVVLLLGFLLLLFVAWVLPGAIDEEGHGKAWVRERMKYHGTDVAECDEKGCWFYRNGQKCKL
jgi:hypothetical protein